MFLQIVCQDRTKMYVDAIALELSLENEICGVFEIAPAVSNMTGKHFFRRHKGEIL